VTVGVGPIEDLLYIHGDAAVDLLVDHARREPALARALAPPPFGYCGGLRSVADARYITMGGAAVALVSAVATGSGTPIPHVTAPERYLPLSQVHVLAGHLPDGPLTTIESSPLRQGGYVIVVGDTGAGGYFPALGLYGLYRVSGNHAFRTCTDFSGTSPQRVTTGITTVRGLRTIFAKALAR
jgi:hypothetical protein